MGPPMPVESVQPGARLVFGICFLAIMGIILAMIRMNAVREKYILLWLPLGLGFFGLSLFPGLLVVFSARIHLHYMTVVVLGVIVVFTNILLFLTMRLSQLREDVKSLAQEIALTKAGDPARLPQGASQGLPAGQPPAWLPAPREPELGPQHPLSDDNGR
jgi:hypothetical protein